MFKCFACGQERNIEPVNIYSAYPAGWDTINISGQVYLFCESCLPRSGLYYPGIKSVKGRVYSFKDLSPIMQEMLKEKIK
jgi:hypothetical protein